jgi:protein gp37
MSTASTIEWTRGDDGSAGATWNPVTGCTKVSEGYLFRSLWGLGARGRPRIADGG